MGVVVCLGLACDGGVFFSESDGIIACVRRCRSRNLPAISGAELRWGQRKTKRDEEGRRSMNPWTRLQRHYYYLACAFVARVYVQSTKGRRRTIKPRVSGKRRTSKRKLLTHPLAQRECQSGIGRGVAPRCPSDEHSKPWRR